MSEPTGQFWIEGKNLGETIETIQRWCNHTFPQQITNPERIMSHLEEEHLELISAFQQWQYRRMEPDRQSETFKQAVLAGEIADNIMLLAALCSALHIDILKALQDKHRVNLNRAWADSGKGHDKHVEEKS